MSIEVAAALGSAIGGLISFFLGYSVGRRAKVMSMISAQCDELRSMSESVGLAMPQAATLMMEAADTIDCLDAENAKLREENQSIGLAAYELGRKSIAGENAKLRELVHEALLFGDERSYQEIRYRLKQEARELGVEVDE